MHWVSVNQTWPSFFIRERVFLSCLGAAKPSKKHMNLGKGKVFSGRVILFLAIYLKFLGANIPEMFLSISCCFVWMFAWLPFLLWWGFFLFVLAVFFVCFGFVFSTCSNLTVFFSFSSPGPQTDTRCRERTLCQICCQQVDSDTVYSLRPLWTLHYFPNEADC